MAAQAKAAALEAENAALREVTAAVAKAVEGLSLGEGEDDRLDWSVILKIGDLRRARAYLAAQTAARSTLIECRVRAGQSASELAALAAACRTEEG